MTLNIPNILTVLRIVAIPVIVALFFVSGRSIPWIICILFSLAAITDYFDGYLARSWKQISAFGRFLDPIADKLLVAAVLMMLAYVGKLSGFAIIPAVIILTREILVSGLREFLAGIKVNVAVSKLAKWKTALQMVAIGFLIIGNDGPAIIPVKAIGEIGLWIAGLLTIITGWDYLVIGMRHVNDRDAKPIDAA